MPLIATPDPLWRMVLTTPMGSPVAVTTKIGEILDAREREFNFKLNQPGTISFKQNLLSPQATQLLAQKEGLILLYRNKVLQMVADIQTLEATGDDTNHEVTVTAVETMWSRLTASLVGASTSGQAGPASATDQGTWLNTTLAGKNAALSGLAHSSIGTSGTITASGNITGGKWYYKPFMELMQELSASIAGFDFWQTPVDPTVTALTGQLNIAPLKGTTKSNVVFEYGTGNNSASAWRYLIDDSQLANVVQVLPPTFPDNAGLKIALSSDGPSFATRGWREVVQPSDLSDYTLRKSYADLALLVRKKPREQFFIQPAPDDGTGRIPQFTVDYTTGDTIRGRVSDQGVVWLDANVRVYGVKVTSDEEGLENIELTLVNEA